MAPFPLSALPSRALNQTQSVSSRHPVRSQDSSAGVGVGVGFRPHLSRATAPPTSAPIQGAARSACPTGPASSTAASLPAKARGLPAWPHLPPSLPLSRAPQGLRQRRGKGWADVAQAEGGSPRMRMGEPGELKPELPLSWGLGRSL